MRRVVLFIVVAGMLAVHPAIAQDAKRQVQTIETARQAQKALVAAPDATRRDPLSVQAWAKPPRDARPLQGLDNSRIPRYPSVEAFLAKHGPADLRARAAVVGKAELIRQPVSKGLAQGARGVAAPASGLSMGERLRVQRAPNGTIRWLQGHLGRAPVSSGAASKQAALTQAALTVADAYADVLRLDDPASELRPMKTTVDDLGYVHARFEQTYDGLPVWGRDLYVHLDAEGEVYAVNGTYEPTPVGVATTPSLGEADALQTVVGDLEARGRWAPVPDDVVAWLDIEAPQIELMLYPDPERGVRLAYAVSLHPNFLEWYTYLVDAQTGGILGRIARHCTLHHQPGVSPPVRVSGLKPPAPSASSGRGTFFDASATDLNGVTQNLRVYQHDDNIFYNVWDLPNLDENASNLPNDPDGGALTISANETDFGENVNLTHVTSDNNTWDDPASVSAHVNMNIVYTYYKNTHNRDAIDGNDQSMISVIHVTDEGRPMDNAFWNGRVMAYGDGEQAFLPLAGGLDVAAHEVTHGVIENTAGLIYQFQPGALNESFADVFGVLVEPNDFFLGEDIMRAGVAVALRDLLNPDNPNVLSDQPAHMSDFVNLNADQDNGGVHINSGIPNRAAALIIQLLGLEAAEQIYYRALTTYLTRNSQFGDARNALEQSAIDLFPQIPSVALAVTQSFDDVGILGTTGMENEEGNDLPPQTGGESLVALMTDDGTIGLLNLTDPQSPTVATYEDPGAVGRFNEGDGTQLTTPLDGETIWFINPDRKLAVLGVESGLVAVFDDLFIAQEGDLWNASVSPTGDFVALVSAYENDPTLYIFDGENLGAIDLKPETTQEGVQDETIQFPDVASWSPNPSDPRIVFDALNEVDFVGESTIRFWSIYEIDFDAGTILNLIPAQPDDISVGNITYSNTDPDRVAFNVIDEENTWDVLLGDFATGDVDALGIPDFTINDVPITDAARPTFSPDDTQLAFTSDDFGVLLLYNLENGNLPFLDLRTALGSSVFNPYWFTRGGSGGTGNQTPTADFTASTTSGEAPLTVDFDASFSTDPDGDPLSYRWDFGDGSTGGGPTVSHTFSSGGAKAVTLTVLDSGGLSDTATLEIVVAAPAGAVVLRSFDPQGDQVVVIRQNDRGFPLGTNPFRDRAKATAFALPGGLSQALIDEVNVWFGAVRDGLTNETYSLEFFAGTPETGPTGAPFYSETFPLADVSADADPNTAEPPTNHVLSQAVSVGPSFFVSVDFGDYGVDSLRAALVSSERVGQRVPEVWEKEFDETWDNVSDNWFGDGTFGSGTDGWRLWVEVIGERVSGTPVEEAEEIPRALALSANYPNPFRTVTTLRFELPTRTDVTLHIVDLLGRTVATLVEEPMEAGVHTVRFEAGSLPSGVYLARLRAGSATQSRKLVLLK